MVNTIHILTKKQRAIFATLSSLLLVIPTFLLSLLGLLVAGMRCDEGCSDRATSPGLSWRSYSDSWQWSAQLWLVVASLAFAIATTVVAARGSRTASIWCAFATVAFAGGWWLWVAG